MSAIRPISGFSALDADLGEAIGGVASQGFRDKSQIAQAALRARTRIERAKLDAEAVKYQGEQAGASASFGGLMNGIGGIASGLIGGLKKPSVGRASGPLSGKTSSGVYDVWISPSDIDLGFDVPTTFPSFWP